MTRMKRKEFDVAYTYCSAKCCLNCGSVEDVSGEDGSPPGTYLQCTQMINRGVDNIKVDKKHVCDIWRPK